MSRNVLLEAKLVHVSDEEADHSQDSVIFSDAGVIHLLRVAIRLLKKGQRYELVRY